MFNLATVVFNLIEEAEVKMPSQEFNSIDINQLKMDLERAAITLKRLPRNYLDKPTGIRSNWSDFAQNQIRMAKGRQTVIHPSSEEIDQLEIFLTYIITLAEIERIVVWARANRLPWSFLKQKFNRSRSHLTSIYKKSLFKIMAKK